MKIVECYSGFMDFVDIGKYGYIIKTDKLGVETHISEIVDKAKFFDRVFINGKITEDDFMELTDFIKSLKKRNAKSKVYIDTDCKRKPTGFGKIKNIKYNVYIDDYKDKEINYDVLNWFNQTDSRFIFEVSNADDLSTIELLLMDFPVEKSKIYIKVTNNILELKEIIKSKGYNIAPIIRW